MLGLTLMWMRPEPRPEIRADRSAPAFGRRDAGRLGGAAGRRPAPGADFGRVQKVVEQRCLLCHGAQVQMKNVRLDSPQEIASHAQAIYQQVVVSRVMPMSNSTGMTDDERALIDTWFKAGAPASPPAERPVAAPVPPLPSFLPRLHAHLRRHAALPRDAGYGRNPPHALAGGARIAVQFVLNYEEGGENSVLHGDPGSEQFLSEMFNPASYPDRHLSMESIYEYGSRAGVWRILREFEKRRLPLTVFGVGMALQRHPELASACVELGHEIACHGWRWVHYQTWTRPPSANTCSWACRPSNS